MIEIVNRDMWEMVELNYTDAICITTNGFVKRNGEAVMGAGVAKQAVNKYKKLINLPKILGASLKEFGNHVYLLRKVLPYVFSFPTKTVTETDPNKLLPYFFESQRGKSSFPGWMCKSSLELIEQSCIELVEYIDDLHLGTVLIPRPGCSNGGLTYEEVRPVLKKYLNDRFVVITNGSG